MSPPRMSWSNLVAISSAKMLVFTHSPLSLERQLMGRSGSLNKLHLLHVPHPPPTAANVSAQCPIPDLKKRTCPNCPSPLRLLLEFSYLLFNSKRGTVLTWKPHKYVITIETHRSRVFDLLAYWLCCKVRGIWLGFVTDLSGLSVTGTIYVIYVCMCYRDHGPIKHGVFPASAVGLLRSNGIRDGLDDLVAANSLTSRGVAHSLQ